MLRFRKPRILRIWRDSIFLQVCFYSLRFFLRFSFYLVYFSWKCLLIGIWVINVDWTTEFLSLSSRELKSMEQMLNLFSNTWSQKSQDLWAWRGCMFWIPPKIERKKLLYVDSCFCCVFADPSYFPPSVNGILQSFSAIETPTFMRDMDQRQSQRVSLVISRNCWLKRERKAKIRVYNSCSGIQMKTHGAFNLK